MGESSGKVYLSGGKNPFLPLDVYVPDGEPKVFEGRIYLYGSKDEFGGEYCCHKYHVYSAPTDHLEEWTDHGPILASTSEYQEEGIEDGVDWSGGLLWAPDVVKRDDTYYLFFCLSDGSEGVAESRRPDGPFSNARRIMMDGKPISGIDPSVLQDGSEFYYTWGQGRCHMARLMEDMCTLDPSSYVEALISQEDGREGFHEASSLRKIGDWYVIVYASTYTDKYPNNLGAPTRLDYAVSKNLYGPYERRGTIIDNTGIDPQSWNNHGSIIKLNGQWYVFYHGSSNNSKYTRRARVERIDVDEERGLIQTAVMTSLGFANALDPEEQLSAAYGCMVWGGAYFTEKEHNFPLVNVRDHSAVTYRYFDFGGQGDWNIVLSGRVLCGGMVTILVNGKEKGRAMCSGSGHFAITSEIKDLSGLAEITLVFTANHDQEILVLETIGFNRQPLI